MSTTFARGIVRDVGARWIPVSK